MNTILEHTGELVVVRCWCGIQHAIPETLQKNRIAHRDNGWAPLQIYCPLGHVHILSGSDRISQVERELQIERQRHDQTRADREYQRKERQAAERQLSAKKGQITKIRNRLAGGNCPCCKAHFDDLKKHVSENHPHYAIAKEAK